MTLEQLKSAKAPFKVKSIHDGEVVTVKGFSENDPLGVGGGIFPDMPVAYFEGGGWLLVKDLLVNFDVVDS